MHICHSFRPLYFLEMLNTYTLSVLDFPIILPLREFGIRKQVKKLVISRIFCTFIGENQEVTKTFNDDYQGQSY